MTSKIIMDIVKIFREKMSLINQQPGAVQKRLASQLAAKMSNESRAKGARSNWQLKSHLFGTFLNSQFVCKM